MFRTLMLGLAATMISTAAFAAVGDHGGFGRDLFATQSPSGFNDPRNYSDNMDAAAAVANQIQPAAGDVSKR